jgi:hypothetical protein
MAGMACSRDVVAGIARLMGVSGYLTEAEADWLEEAGPAWTRR